MARTKSARSIGDRARPLVNQRAPEIQAFGRLARLPNALSQTAALASVENLNQVLADTMTLRDLYKKHHWQVAGPTFYSLHLLFDKHYEEQNELVDLLAERVQSLGGVSIAMAPDVAEVRAGGPGTARHTMARLADESGDDGTNDLLVSDVIRTGEKQVWFLAEHLVDAPTVRAD